MGEYYMKCDCWKQEKYTKGYDTLHRPIYATKFVCFGTKDRDECTCGGDARKCNFYPRVRKKANNTKHKIQIDELALMILQDFDLKNLDPKNLEEFL